MGADDAGRRKLARQVLDIGDRGCLHIQNGNARAVLGDAASQFAQGLDLVNRTERCWLGGNQRLRHPRIALEENYIERLHYFPLASTARHGDRAVTALHGRERCHRR